MALPLLPLLLLAGVVRTPDTPSVCDRCAEWNQPQVPFQVVGNTYYVGVHGLSAVLIDTGQGLILLDGGLPQSAPLIEANLKQLGFRIQDVKVIANSHAHYDHAGGIGALQRDSGAQVVASSRGAEALRQGCPTADDPQAGNCDAVGFPAVAKVREIGDGEAVKVGELALTAHLTPGHTPGSTSWSWQSCEGKTCFHVVLADSLTAVSAEGFLFTGNATHADASRSFAQSIDKVAALPCEVVLSVHPDFTDTWEKASRQKAGQPNPFVDAAGCRTYAAQMQERLAARLAQERARRSP